MQVIVTPEGAVEHEAQLRALHKKVLLLLLQIKFVNAFVDEAHTLPREKDFRDAVNQLPRALFPWLKAVNIVLVSATLTAEVEENLLDTVVPGQKVLRGFFAVGYHLILGAQKGHNVHQSKAF